MGCSLDFSQRSSHHSFSLRTCSSSSGASVHYGRAEFEHSVYECLSDCTDWLHVHAKVSSFTAELTTAGSRRRLRIRHLCPRTMANLMLLVCKSQLQLRIALLARISHSTLIVFGSAKLLCLRGWPPPTFKCLECTSILPQVPYQHQMTKFKFHSSHIGFKTRKTQVGRVWLARGAE
jgi:hypothetical protein